MCVYKEIKRALTHLTCPIRHGPNKLLSGYCANWFAIAERSINPPHWKLWKKKNCASLHFHLDIVELCHRFSSFVLRKRDISLFLARIREFNLLTILRKCGRKQEMLLNSNDLHLMCYLWHVHNKIWLWLCIVNFTILWLFNYSQEFFVMFAQVYGFVWLSVA